MQWIQMLIGLGLVGCGTMLGWYLSKARNISRARGDGFMLAVKIYRESFMNMEKEGIITVDWRKMAASIDCDDLLENTRFTKGTVVPFPTKDK